MLLFLIDTMIIKFDDGIPVTLEQMLFAKEQRVKHQQAALEQFNHPLICLSLVIPGPIKKSCGTNLLFQEAIKAIKSSLASKSIVISNEQYFHANTGSEAIISAKYQADELKQLCIDIENHHPLGRLWDIDVIDPITQHSISRTVFDEQSRQCLICLDNAKNCSRSKKHSLDEIFAVIENRLKDYLKSQ